MTHKIYLITHLDTGMRYVGITSGELLSRWQQHYNDPKSAVYKALRTEGYRMTMELLEEVNNRDEALLKEQAYIQELNTAEPNGWNRKVTRPIKWKATELTQRISYDSGYNIFCCPKCGHEYTHQKPPEVYTEGKSQGICIPFECETCHNFPSPPDFKLFIYQRKGHTYIETIHYERDNS